jgi:hypothetical protein
MAKQGTSSQVFIWNVDCSTRCDLRKCIHCLREMTERLHDDLSRSSHPRQFNFGQIISRQFIFNNLSRDVYPREFFSDNSSSEIYLGTYFLRAFSLRKIFSSSLSLDSLT